MGYYVHLSVIFACDRNDGVAALARKHSTALSGKEEDGQREAKWFLDALGERIGPNYGPKGGVSAWGTIGNYTRADVFVDTLKPFFLELLRSEIDGGPLDFEHILVFYEPEGSEHASAYEIGMTEPTGSPESELFVRHHEKLPFAWMQM